MSGAEGCETQGPWGGSDGCQWSYVAKGDLTEIVVAHGWTIDSIKFKSVNSNGSVDYSDKFGGPKGDDTLFVLDGPTEYLTGIKGTYGSYEGKMGIRSLCFTSNKREHGPFGRRTEGTSFSYTVKPGYAIVGMYGHGGQYIHAIGIYVKQICEFPPVLGSVPLSGQELCDVMKAVMPRDTGAWGGVGGNHWDDGVFSNINKIYVHLEKSKNLIHAVQFKYEKKDGKYVWTPRHGGSTCDDVIEQITLDCNEYLVGVAGYYGPYEGGNGLESIKCLTFYTNKETYGPFGQEKGIYFASTAFKGKVLGFHGKSGAYLTAIGVHMEYL